MDYNENLTEALAILYQLASANQSTGAKTVGPINTQNHRRVLFLLDIGALGASGTVDFKVQAAATSGGTYADVSGTAITQITAGSTNLVTVEVRHETLMAAGQGPFIKGVLTIGTAASQAGVIALGSCSRHKPSSDANIATTQQIVA